MTDSTKSVYISGPMTGHPKFNFPAFDNARNQLELKGWKVRSPADMEREKHPEIDKLPNDWDWTTTPDWFDFQYAVTCDLDAVRACSHIYMLKGWEDSKGAQAEKALAEWLCKEVMYESTN